MAQTNVGREIQLSDCPPAEARRAGLRHTRPPAEALAIAPTVIDESRIAAETFIRDELGIDVGPSVGKKDIKRPGSAHVSDKPAFSGASIVASDRAPHGSRGGQQGMRKLRDRYLPRVVAALRDPRPTLLALYAVVAQAEKDLGQQPDERHVLVETQSVRTRFVTYDPAARYGRRYSDPVQDVRRVGVPVRVSVAAKHDPLKLTEAAQLKSEDPGMSWYELGRRVGLNYKTLARALRLG